MTALTLEYVGDVKIGRQTRPRVVLTGDMAAVAGVARRVTLGTVASVDVAEALDELEREREVNARLRARVNALEEELATALADAPRSKLMRAQVAELTARTERLEMRQQSLTAGLRSLLAVDVEM